MPAASTTHNHCSAYDPGSQLIEGSLQKRQSDQTPDMYTFLGLISPGLFMSECENPAQTSHILLLLRNWQAKNMTTVSVILLQTPGPQGRICNCTVTSSLWCCQPHRNTEYGWILREAALLQE